MYLNNGRACDCHRGREAVVILKASGSNGQVSRHADFLHHSFLLHFREQTRCDSFHCDLPKSPIYGTARSEACSSDPPARSARCDLAILVHNNVRKTGPRSVAAPATRGPLRADNGARTRWHHPRCRVANRRPERVIPGSPLAVCVRPIGTQAWSLIRERIAEPNYARNSTGLHSFVPEASAMRARDYSLCSSCRGCATTPGLLGIRKFIQKCSCGKS